jgi:hypothetical protein
VELERTADFEVPEQRPQHEGRRGLELTRAREPARPFEKLFGRTRDQRLLHAFDGGRALRFGCGLVLLPAVQDRADPRDEHGSDAERQERPNDRGDDASESVAERRARDFERRAFARGTVVRRSFTLAASAVSVTATTIRPAAVTTAAAAAACGVLHPPLVLGSTPLARPHEAGTALGGSRSEIAEGCFAPRKLVLAVPTEAVPRAESTTERGLDRFRGNEIGLRELGLMELFEDHVGHGGIRFRSRVFCRGRTAPSDQ